MNKKIVSTGLLTALMTLSMGLTAHAADINSTGIAPLGYASADVQIGATVDPTVTLSVSTNSIDFGHINPLVPSYDQNMTVSVQSNSNYKLSVMGAGDLVGTDATKIMTIDHLKVQIAGDASFKDMAKTPVILADNEGNTALKTYNVNLKLATDWQVKPDVYGTTITYKAEQL